MGRLLALPAIIRLGWKWLQVTNTLAYNGMELMTTVKKFCDIWRRWRKNSSKYLTTVAADYLSYWRQGILSKWHSLEWHLEEWRPARHHNVLTNQYISMTFHFTEWHFTKCHSSDLIFTMSFTIILLSFCWMSILWRHSTICIKCHSAHVIILNVILLNVLNVILLTSLYLMSFFWMSFYRL
jgi:hypothetical protein